MNSEIVIAPTRFVTSGLSGLTGISLASVAGDIVTNPASDKASRVSFFPFLGFCTRKI